MGEEDEDDNDTNLTMTLCLHGSVVAMYGMPSKERKEERRKQKLKERKKGRKEERNKDREGEGAGGSGGGGGVRKPELKLTFNQFCKKQKTKKQKTHLVFVSFRRRKKAEN